MNQSIFSPAPEPPSEPTVRRLSVEPVVRRFHATTQTPSGRMASNLPPPKPLPMRAQDFDSDARAWDRPSPFQNLKEAPEPQEPASPPSSSKTARTRPRIDPGALTPEQDLARQAALIGTMQAIGTVLGTRLLLFIAVGIDAALAFAMTDWFGAGAFAAWTAVVLPVVAALDYFGRTRRLP
jgi:hypothetical protein